MRAALVVVLSAAAGCGGPVGVLLPTFPDGRTPPTIVRLSVPSPLGPEGITGDILAGHDGRVRRFMPGVELALLYEQTPEALGWTTRPIIHASSGADRLRRPALVLARDGEAWGPAEPQTIESPTLKGLRFDGPGGCFAPKSCVDALGYCELNCADPAAPTPPTPPEAPRAEPCPEGIEALRAQVAGVEVVRCAGVARGSCGPSQRAGFDGACLPVGRACPIAPERFAEPPPMGRPIYVAPESVGGDGTRAAPWSLEAALAAAAPGDVLMLAAGTHHAQSWPSAATLIGACAERTIVDAPPLIGELHVDGVTLRSAATLRVSASMTIVGAILDANVAVAEDARLDGSGGLVLSSTITLLGELAWRSGELRGSWLTAADGVISLERALLSETSARVERSTLSASETVMFGEPLRPTITARGSTVTLDRIVMTQGRLGVRAWTGSDVTITRSAFEGLGGPGVELRHPQTTAWLSDVTMTAVARPIDLVGPPRAELSRVALLGSREGAIRAEDNDVIGELPTLVAEDLLVDDSGHGVQLRGEITLRRARLAATSGVAILGASTPSGALRLRADDLAVSGAVGAGIELKGHPDQPMEVSGERVAIDASTGIGLSLRTGAGSVRLVDLRIHDTRPATELPQACDPVAGACAGVGLLADPIGLVVELTRFEITNAAAMGVMALPFVSLRAARGLIRGSPICAQLSMPGDPLEWLSEVKLDCGLTLDLSGR